MILTAHLLTICKCAYTHFVLFNVCIYIILLMAMKNSFSVSKIVHNFPIKILCLHSWEIFENKINEWQSQTSNALLFAL